MGELANCPNCSNLFVKGLRLVCDKCFKEDERNFETVYEFIRKKENRTATVAEVSKATGVSEKHIMKYVREKRLLPSNFPNLTYACRRCGKGIQEGKLCDDCQYTLRKDLIKDEELEALEKQNQKKPRSMTYFSIGRDKE
ncbi:TIGR03826 family flagellar region protein [Salirhabdus salicampi]|uniref:TIGR03826 family flagellar region protein n=1 Tax=Salirhabdus salicampi TaxID=476102 RepID=UPI0020C33C54|nr:TIGR03826 family flagellar region protein [Salirhabdus salicampi]MCP8617594.1 hypothetical protein [Salirhabdus salicampi]